MGLEAAREGTITRQLGSINKELERLTGNIGDLEGKISPVLGLCNPTLLTGGDSPGENTDLGEKLREICSKINKAADAVCDLSKRVEF